jgi:murein DD-endopeptidase MepM/ murein hydrolase activator NlpD
LFTPGKSSQEFTIPVNVSKREFRTQYFSLPPATQKLFEQDYQTPTWNLIYGAMDNPAPEPLWTTKFKLPTTGRITLGFGDRLYINKKYSGSHFGIDYANKTGTPVYATNSGTVKLASMTPAYGNVIVIDHGLNIYSMYLHLDSFNVKAGDQVKQGNLIAKIGSTGLSNGPHLHFTMFVGHTIVDSDQWIK